VCAFKKLTASVMTMQPKSAQSDLMTAAETCRYLRITPRTLYRYIQDRRMPAFKLGKEWRFVRSDLEQWLRRRVAVHRRSH
jgi:excisionase family DNA binding protein